MFQTKVVENIETHFSCLIFFFSKNYAVYEIMQTKIVGLDWPQMTIWRMLIAWGIPKATHTHTHSEYVILIAFPLQQLLH